MKIELSSKDPRKGKFVVDQFPVILGLDPGSDICLDDSSVGHYQCMIDDGDEGLTVWDLGTKSGTYINGVRVQKKNLLLPGDELTIGRNRFVVHYEHNGAKQPRHGDAALGADSKPQAAAHQIRQPAAS